MARRAEPSPLDWPQRPAARTTACGFRLSGRAKPWLDCARLMRFPQVLQRLQRHGCFNACNRPQGTRASRRPSRPPHRQQPAAPERVPDAIQASPRPETRRIFRAVDQATQALSLGPLRGVSPLWNPMRVPKCPLNKLRGLRPLRSGAPRLGPVPAALGATVSVGTVPTPQ